MQRVYWAINDSEKISEINKDISDWSIWLCSKLPSTHFGDDNGFGFIYCAYHVQSHGGLQFFL